MHRKTTRITLDLNQLHHAEKANALVELIKHAELDSPTLRAIRDAAAARLTQTEIGTDFSSLRANREAKRRAQMTERVWGVGEPSVPSLRQYLKSLRNLGDTSYAEKKELVKTVNYWKKELKVEFRIGAEACTLKAIPTHNGRGAFQLRATGSEQRSLYGNASFPAIRVESIDRTS